MNKASPSVPLVSARSPIKNDFFDVIVVGAGSAGCVVAHRLSKMPGLKVLLIEAGSADNNFWLKLPIGYYRTIHDPRFSWGYVGASEAGLNGRKIEHPRGKVLGGCSAVNGLVYVRGAASDYNQWAEAVEDARWSYRNVLPLFKKSECNHDIHDAFHGTAGEIQIARPNYQNAFLDAFVASALKAGVPTNSDFNGHTLDGVGYYQLTAAHGLRSSTARAFLSRQPDSHLTIQLKQHVSRVIIDKSRAVGIEVITCDGSVQRIYCNHEVILCAGAINTPKLLQLSGIGPQALLHSLNISPAVVNEAVGMGLQDHLQARVIFETIDRYSLNALQGSLLRRMKAGIQYLFSRSGELTIGAGVVGLFAHSTPGLLAPDIQFHVIPFSAALPGQLHKVGGVTVSVCALRPQSRGWVKAISQDPRMAPEICCNYLSAPEDLLPLRTGLRLLEQIAGELPLANMIKSRLFPAILDVNNMASVDDHIRSTGSTIFHPVGTCAMGKQERGVVDGHLRVIGVDGLRVADASIMPTIVSGNTNAASIMIGERAAQEVIADLTG